MGLDAIVRCYGITKDPETNNFMMVMEYAQNGSLRQHLNNSFNSLNWNNKLYNLFYDFYKQTNKSYKVYDENSLIYQQIRETDEINKQLPPLTIPSTDILSYATHPQAIYTSRLLDFKSLPEPQNADNDKSFETEYSGN